MKTINIPSSKSQTIRALIIACFARGKSILNNPLLSSDTQACLDALKTLNCDIKFNEDSSKLYVDSSNLDIKDKTITIDTANSGTTTYLLYGLLSTLGAKEIILTGDEQLNNRPIKKLVDAYKDLGVEAQMNGENPPVKILSVLKGGKTTIECKTSQYLSSLLLSLPLAKEDSEVTCSLLYEKPYVNLTLDWLDKQNIEYKISEDFLHTHIKGGQKYKPFETTLTGDFSSASFFFVAAAILGTEIKINGLDENDKQGDKRLLDILTAMGCEVKWEDFSVIVKGPKELKGGTFDLNDIPDALPILSICGLKTTSALHLVNVEQARIKETDRISCMCSNLKILGANIEERNDGMSISKGKVKTGQLVSGYSDHRIIMAMAICSLIIDLEIDDKAAVDVTFPSFFELFDSIK